MEVLKAPVEGVQSVRTRVVGFCEYQRGENGSGFVEKRSIRSRAGQSRRKQRWSRGIANADIGRGEHDRLTL